MKTRIFKFGDKLVFSRDRHKNLAGVNELERSIREKWDLYQRGKSIQENFTPLKTVMEMVSKVDVRGKSVLVIANSETFLFLKTMKDEEPLKYKSLHFLTDIKDLDGKDGVIYKDFKNINKMKFPSKFDIVIGNPPYSGKDIKFMNKCLEIAKEKIVFVHPSTAYMDKKGADASYISLKEKIENKIEYLSIFNGNTTFKIKTKYPCSVVVIDQNKNSKSFTFENKFNKTISTQVLERVSFFSGDDRFYSFSDKIKDVLKSHVSLDAKSSLRNKDTSKPYYVSYSPIAGSTESVDHTRDFYKENFFIIAGRPSLKVLENNGGDTPYLLNWYFDTEEEAENFIEYTKTNFARACLATVKISANLHRGELRGVPYLDFTQKWDDKRLYKEFGISQDEVEFINQIILPYYN